jgi:DNA modification methylase
LSRKLAAPEMKVRCRFDELISTKELLTRQHPENPNDHPAEQIERLAEIMAYQGPRHPIVISKLSGRITKGHGRLLSAVFNGWETYPVEYQDYDDEEQEYADVVADNAIALWAELDLSAVNGQVQHLGPEFDINMLGLRDFEIEPADKYADKDADETPEVRKTEIKRGDLFQLGQHRLLCGDATSKEDVERLMNGEKADVVYTDPPYGMNLDTDRRGMGNTTTVYKPIVGDSEKYDPSPCLAIPAKSYWLWGADYYSDQLPDGGSWIVWAKAHNEDENKVWGSSFEICWTSPKRKKEIWFVRRIHMTNEHIAAHPTQKPLGVITRALNLESDAKNIVDLYLGSGSTLIACEKTNRKCFGMEIDPQYCQVIIDRWEKFTGQKAAKL